MPAPLRKALDQAHRGEYRAMQMLAAAEAKARSAGDGATATLAAAASLLAGQSLGHYRRFEECLAALAGLRAGDAAFGAPAQDLLAHAGLLAGLLMLAPRDPDADRTVERIVRLLELDVDVNLKFAAGRVVLFYSDPRELRVLGHHVDALLEPLVDDPALTSFRLGRWLIFKLRTAAHAKDRSLYAHTLRQAQALAARTGEPGVVVQLALSEVDEALPLRDAARLERARASLAAAVRPGDLGSMRALDWVDGRIALSRGEGDRALFHALRARRYGEEAGLPKPVQGVQVALEAQARAMTRDFDGARRVFREAASMVAVLHAEEMRDMLRMVDAWEAVLARRDDATALLREAFAASRARQFYDSFDGNPRLGATLCALALEREVEPEFVSRIIALNHYAPPPEAGRRWPWPVVVECLGGFAIRARGEPVATRGKAQKKPLDLARLLASANGRNLDKRRIVDLLWPDAEAGDATAALDMTLTRLRKLLRDPAAIVTEDARIGFNRERVFVDAWAFDRAVDDLRTALSAGDDAATAEHVETLLSLYRGDFLEGGELPAWALAAHERARSRFLRSLCDVARHWQARGRQDDSAALCERGLEVDARAEELWRELIRSHIALGRPAAALLAYRRCSEFLAGELGVPPSAETEALYRSLPQSGPSASHAVLPGAARTGTRARTRIRGRPIR